MDRGRGGGGFRGGGGGFRGRGGCGGFRGRGGGGGGRFQKSGPDDPRISSEVQIFVEGLPKNAKVPELVQYFSTVGEIKVDRMSKQPRVHLYKDKQTGEPLGEATITYRESGTQKTALQTYNNQMYQGQPIRVSPSIVKPHMAKPPPPGSGGGGRGRGRGGGRGGGGGFRGRGGDRGRGGFGGGGN